MLAIEGCCRFIFRIDHQGVGRDFRAGGTVERIGQQRAAQTLPFESLIRAYPVVTPSH